MARRVPDGRMRCGAAVPRPVPRGARGERGSVLMEGVLVLPLYLMLLGALFIVGDLAMGRLALLAGERAVTWLAGDRFGNDPDPAVQAAMDVSSMTLEGGEAVEAVRGEKRIGNHWLDAYQGYIVLGVHVPYWVELANADHGTRPREGAGNGELPFRDGYVLPDEDTGGGNRYWRSCVVRRLEDAGEAYDRSASAVQLLANVERNVVGEPWVVGGEAGYHDLREPAGPSDVKPYSRINDFVLFGE